jgi:Tfp pilus assembly protein PilF
MSRKRYIDKYISIRKDNSLSEANIATGLAGIYSEADVLDKAEAYYRKALILNLVGLQKQCRKP